MQSNNGPVRLVVVGSVGLDTIATPVARRANQLGGSASYACAAASFFTRVGLVGVVGTDFPQRCRRTYDRFGLELAGLQVRSGKTFRWSGVYEDNMDRRRTLSTELNVFAAFLPELPPAYRASPFLFLANISPSLQLHVLDQMRRPRFVAADTMDLWINTALADLHRVIRRVDLLTLNESEARHLTGQRSLFKAAARLLKLGPRYLIIKKGEHGSILFTPRTLFLMPAFPLEDVCDPTGAGDMFAGGLMGSLADADRISDCSLRKAMLYGSVIASFGVESFSLERLSSITRRDIEKRALFLKSISCLF